MYNISWLIAQYIKMYMQPDTVMSLSYVNNFSFSSKYIYRYYF